MGKFAKIRSGIEFVVFLFVMLSLVYTPGTVTFNNLKSGENDNVPKLKLSDVKIPVSLLSFSLLLLIVSIVLGFKDKIPGLKA